MNILQKENLHLQISLKTYLKSNNIVHSYLFYGKEGIGKKEFAIQFAKGLLCISEENRPCNECKSCIEFSTKNNPDFFIVVPDGNSIKINQIRLIQKTIIEKPINNSKKVYIIDYADKMTVEAQNCLLKTLEEPQDFIVIILIASDENKLLNTVKSRCTKIYFQEITNDEILKYIKGKNSNNNYILETIFSKFNKVDNNIMSIVNNILKTSFSGILNITLGITNVLINLILGLVISIYILLEKESLKFQIKTIICKFMKIS